VLIAINALRDRAVRAWATPCGRKPLPREWNLRFEHNLWDTTADSPQKKSNSKSRAIRRISGRRFPLEIDFSFGGGTFGRSEALPEELASRYPGLDAMPLSRGGQPMSRCLQRASAVLITVALLLVQVGPAAASRAQEVQDRGHTNLVADALFLRPLGLAMVGFGAAIWAVGVAPIVALTRPTDLGESMNYLIMRPVKYTFADPLGHH
jgi:hypothetical protein